ncbi:MAG: bifunctional folylpolyglutamate synthase/dihydrofolate synthase [Syntrophomonadaceae bacterium]|nr:bifunctional folylpolyglutamate synthase/dihydrofolate synthase [Syntrophomonadaceae bacterium]MDD3022956.1 bifunctional folylpolyglutamate synthase/dihydrofolate synthase [Syntrophomonadaceae bacterium]
MEKIERLLAELDHPEKGLQCVHIAGTNGKGSNSFMMASFLRQAGYRVGRFISPHIHSYCERFAIDGTDIPGDVLLSYLEMLGVKIDLMLAQGFNRPTEFEILTALALQYFKDEEVDIAVLEVGMGGLYDSTNVVIPMVSVITGIACDHTAYLGSTLEAIAQNKAGIIKHKIPAVIASMDDNPRRILEMQAAQMESPVFYSSMVKVIPNNSPAINGRMLDIEIPGLRLKDVFFPLLGEYQLKNLATVLTTLIALGQNFFALNGEIIRTALQRLKVPGRMEIIKHQHLVVVLDAAHNPQAAEALAESLAKLFPGKQKVLLCGVLDDKDAQNILGYLAQGTGIFLFTKPSGPRGQEWQRLERMVQQLYPDIPVYLEERIDKAVELGISLTREDSYLLVTGSFYVLDQARSYLTRG